jgi:hypothetical protein
MEGRSVGFYEGRNRRDEVKAYLCARIISLEVTEPWVKVEAADRRQEPPTL